jgi:hypothetical protein
MLQRCPLQHVRGLRCQHACRGVVLRREAQEAVQGGFARVPGEAEGYGHSLWFFLLFSVLVMVVLRWYRIVML